MKIPIIDCHYHNCQWFADNGSYIKAQREYRKVCGIDTVNVLCLPNLKDLFVNRDITQNILAAILKLEDETIYAHGSLYYLNHPVSLPIPGKYEFYNQAKILMEIGFDGIKMLETKPNAHKLLAFPVSSSEYDDYFEYLEKNNIHILWHVNDPEDFWDKDALPKNARIHGWFYGDGTYASKEQIYGEVYDVLKRYPKLKVTFPHCFFLSRDPQRLIDLLETYKNICIDITPGVEMYEAFSQNYNEWKSIFIKYSERILFGTDIKSDTPISLKIAIFKDIIRFLTTEEYYNGFSCYGYNYKLKGFGLTEKCLENIFSKNFLKRAGTKPRKINRKALKEYIEQYKTIIPEGKTKESIMQYYTQNLKNN